MTVTDEPSSYTPVDPELGRSASAKARAAAEGETPDGGALRAQPRARAHARDAVGKARTVRDNRRAALQARGSGAASRDSILEARPPSLAELGRRVSKGPVRAVRLPDGTVTEESVEWSDIAVTAWKLYMGLALVFVAAPGHLLLWCEEKPSRTVGLAFVGLLVWGVATAGAALPVPVGGEG